MPLRQMTLKKINYRKNVYIYTYNLGSNGAKELSRRLNIQRIRHDGSRFQGARHKHVINWGASELPPEVQKCLIANKSGAIRLVSNKRDFFRLMTDAKATTDARPQPRVVPWTCSKKEAEKWVSEGHTVVARTVLTGSSGDGIIIVGGKNRDQAVPDAPLYTQYIFKDQEFRVHIVQGNVIDAQRKIRDPNREPTDWKVRSHKNGFIFAREGFTLPEDVRSQALLAFKASGLDFGAVDVIYHDKTKKAYILEVNSAPGLQGTTIESYAKAFERILNG